MRPMVATLALTLLCAVPTLVHAQADWHWQSATTTLPVVALLAGGAALVGRGERWSHRAQVASGAVLIG